MKKKPDQPRHEKDLRNRAEDALTRKGTGYAGGAEDAVDGVRLLHELQVHQIELEMQNEELRRSRAEAETLLARYTELYDFAPVGYATIDSESVIRQVNLTGAQILGIDRSQLVNRRLALSIADIDQRLFSDFMQTVFELRTRGGCEVALRAGERRPVVARIEGMISADGTECHAVLIDITERRRADAVLRLQSTALDAASSAMIITDRTGVITWANPAFATLTGFPLDEAIGRTPHSLVSSGVHDEAFFRDLWDTILAGRVWHGEVTNRRKDGTLYVEDLAITPVTNERGEVSNFISIKRDMSSEKALQSQFLQAQKMEGVGRLAGGVAHDFNNLMTVINGMVELALADLRPNHPLHADLKQIRHAAERATTLTRHLLAFSRQQVMRPEVLDMNELVGNLLRLLRRVIGEDIELVTHFADGLGAVRADRGQLEQVIMNLSINAREAVARGGTLTFETGNVHVASEESVRYASIPPGHYVTLGVTDTGAGMDTATQARIFEPFFTTKDASKSTGLGLSTVYGIVAQSGGYIRVDSAIGKGTEFTIYLPRVAELVATPRVTPSSGLAVGSETVLIVDDEAALRLVAARILTRSGYHVLTAASGDEAIRMLERHESPVDLLLTDVVMPGMSGPQLVARLEHSHPGIKSLYASGYTDDTVLRHGVSDDAVNFIGKPYSIDELTRKVRETLDR